MANLMAVMGDGKSSIDREYHHLQTLLPPEARSRQLVSDCGKEVMADRNPSIASFNLERKLATF
jgi:hypothetical protein